MYSSKKGKSKSTKPLRSSADSWIKHKTGVVEKLVVKFGKEDKTPSQIGLLLRDQYGIPDVRNLTKDKITKILEENGMKKAIPYDLLALMKRAVTIRKHLETNKADYNNTRNLLLTESKIKRLSKYYRTTGKLAMTWKYDPEEARLLVE